MVYNERVINIVHGKKKKERKYKKILREIIFGAKHNFESSS